MYSEAAAKASLAPSAGPPNTPADGLAGKTPAKRKNRSKRAVTKVGAVGEAPPIPTKTADAVVEGAAVGKERKRSVWPVGAVSKTITEYSMLLTCLRDGLVGSLYRSRGR